MAGLFFVFANSSAFCFFKSYHKNNVPDQALYHYSEKKWGVRPTESLGLPLIKTFRKIWSPLSSFLGITRSQQQLANRSLPKPQREAADAKRAVRKVRSPSKQDLLLYGRTRLSLQSLCLTTPAENTCGWQAFTSNST